MQLLVGHSTATLTILGRFSFIGHEAAILFFLYTQQKLTIIELCFFLSATPSRPLNSTSKANHIWNLFFIGHEACYFLFYFSHSHKHFAVIL